MSRARDLRQRLQRAVEVLSRLVGLDADRSIRSPLERALSQLAEYASRGYPSRSRLTGGRGGDHDLASRVAEALDAGRSAATDEFDRARLELVRLALTVISTVERMHRIVQAATLTVDRSTAARDTSLDECRLCAAVGHHSVVYARGLCDWCWRLAQRLGCDPHTELVRRHNLGRRVTVDLIARYHPHFEEGRT